MFPFFKGFTKVSLTPLANLMNSEVFSHGECFIKEGFVPNKFYMISKGSCEMVSERMARRRNQPSRLMMSMYNLYKKTGK
jgi:hypothetical protein